MYMSVIRYWNRCTDTFYNCVILVIVNERKSQTHTHARTHARTHAHTHTECGYNYSPFFTPVSLQSSGAVWKSRWTSWAPVPNKPTVSVDVKHHSTNLCRSVLGTEPDTGTTEHVLQWCAYMYRLVSEMPVFSNAHLSLVKVHSIVLLELSDIYYCRGTTVHLYSPSK